MSVQPSLSRSGPTGSASGMVLMLHGGKDRSDQVVDGRSASWRRCLAMQRSISGPAHAADAAVWLLRYRHRGWNGGAHPVADARWALDEVRRELGEVPVALLGHSMGARTAIHVADDPSVVGVVGLAPWFPPDEDVTPLTGRHLLAAHGRRDRITSYRATEAFVGRAASVATSTEFRDMGPAGHYLLRRVAEWNRVASAGSLAMLDGARGSVGN